MAMKRCPICGEKYSDTYKTCPFCEEEEALQSGSQIRRNTGRGGKRAARSRQPNLLSPILIVLIVIMAALLVYLLFGDRIAQRMVVPVVQPRLRLVDELDETERGAGGFGSTGK